MLRDLRYACRTLWNSPAFALTAVLSIGLGVGGNTTVFAWIDNIIRNPFPAIPEGGALVALNVADRDGRVDGMPPIAFPTLEDWESRLTTFDSISAHAAVRLNLRTGASALGEPIWAELVDADFLDTVRVRVAQGRGFTDTDRQEHASVVIVSHRFWQRRLGGADDVLGRSLLFNGVPLSIIGIAPARFDGVVMGLAFDAWVPAWQQAALLTGGDWLRDRSARRWQAVARLRPATTLGAANRELLSVAVDVSRSFGETPMTGAAARWVSDTQLGSLMGPLSSALIGITAIVLLSACANVAGLLLSRSLVRRRQTAIQVALGAARSRLIRQALAESVVLAVAGCVLGIWIAGRAKDALTLFVPRVALPVSLEIDLNWRVLIFAACATLVAVLCFAVVPALRASRLDIVEALKGLSRSSRGRPSRLRQGLVVAQVTFSLISLTTASLFLRSVQAAGQVPLGFVDPRRVLLVSTDLSCTRSEGEALAALVDRVLELTRDLPGARSAAFSTIVPLSFGPPPALNTRVDGYVSAQNEPMLIGRAVVSDGYFEMMDIPIVEGRSIERLDRARAARVVVVNEAFRSRFWPGQSALGRRLDQGDGWATVVGVARDTVVEGLGVPVRPLTYHPFGQVAPTNLTLHVRSDRDPLLLVQPVRNALATVHADLPVLDPRTLSEHMGAGTFVQSVGSAVVGAFGLVALLIAGMGLYGIVATDVAERRRDIAVATAIGAPPLRVLAGAVGPAIRLTAIGAIVGGGISLVIASLIRRQLVGISPADPLALIGSVTALAIVAAFACLGPAWRAARIDPVAVLRS